MARIIESRRGTKAVGPALIAAMGLVMALAASGCSSDDSDSTSGDGGGAGSGTSGASTGGSGGTIPMGGTSTGGTTGSGGTVSAGGAMSTGGSMSNGGVMSGGNGSGTQPLGAICANDSNCAQAEGAAVCCASSCTLADQCPSSPTYLPCDSAADCSMYGGGKLCCEAGSGNQVMRFCTKQSACSGRILP
ncbi:MAG TPA: hypothetical protein VF103_06670 [Polyangiaceae bacterium]